MCCLQKFIYKKVKGRLNEIIASCVRKVIKEQMNKNELLELGDKYSISDILSAIENSCSEEEYNNFARLCSIGIDAIKNGALQDKWGEYWKDWDSNKRNFPINYKGKEFWQSRSSSTVLITFCYDENGQLCLLANRRGSGTPDFQGCWNACCGYLDYNETTQECAQRETYEETGVNVPLNKIKLFSVNSSPSENRQNIAFVYYAILDGTTSDYGFSTEASEENEVSNIKWIPINEIDKYQWAFNHDNIAKAIISKKF